MAITKLNSLAIPDNTIVEADLSYPLTNFSSTGIDDNATSTKLTVSDAGIDVTGTADVDGTVNSRGLQAKGSPSLSFNASNWMTQQETGVARTYICGPDASTYQPWEIYRATSTGGASLTMKLDASGNVGIGNSSPSDAYVTAPNLVLGNTSDTFSGMTLFTSASGSQRILFADGTTGTDNRVGQLAYDHSDNSMAFSTNAAERIRVDSDGIVKLITANDTSGTTKRLTFGTNAFNRAEIRCTNAATYDGSLEFWTGNSSNYLERMRILPTGGITFNGDTAAANALDDYEEGTSTTFVYGITATTNEVKMNYVKVGSLVHIIGEVNISGKSAGAANPYFTLPFSPSSTFAFTSTVGASIHYNTISSNINYFGLYTSNAAVYGNTTSGTYGNNYVWHTLWSDGRIGFSLTYTAF